MIDRGLLLAGFWPALLAAQEAAPVKRDPVFDVPIHVELPVTPQIFPGDDGRRHIAYHAFFLNLGNAELVFDRLDVIDTDRNTALVSYDPTPLRRPAILHVQLPDTPRRETLRRLPPGRIALFRAWITLDSAQPAPRPITHRITFAPIPTLRIARALNDTDAVAVVTLEPLSLVPESPVVIGPPLRGGPWRASGGASPVSYHLGLGVLDGRGRMAERFAVDFQKVDSAGSILPNPFPDTLNNRMFYSDRAEVLAVADGEVALVHDGMPANVPTPSGDENMPIPRTRESGPRNQVGIRIRDGVYAQNAHLAPNSIRVKVGDRVRKGQVIGLVGNVGNSKNPHLHFPSPTAPKSTPPRVCRGSSIPSSCGGITGRRACPTSRRLRNAARIR